MRTLVAKILYGGQKIDPEYLGGTKMGAGKSVQRLAFWEIGWLSNLPFNYCYYRKLFVCWGKNIHN